MVSLQIARALVQTLFESSHSNIRNSPCRSHVLFYNRTPIWVVIVLTLAQIVVWLSLFECNRRSKNMAIVFDRRRQTHPERTPPPLMRRRGLLNGWLGFEWWRLQLNQDYYRLSQQEYDKRLDEEDERDHGPKYDKQLLEAEKQCQKEAFQAVPEDYKIELFQKRESFDEAGLSSSMAAVGHAENGAGDEESVEIELPDAGLPSRPKGHVRRTSSGGSSSEWDARIVMGIGDFLANRVLKTAATDVDSSDDEEEHVRAHGVYSSATLSAQHSNDESIHSGIKGLRLGYIRKVNRRRLSKEQRELLRIVGLDAFMTLRFLRFGFDVTFWPLLLACAMLIPIYKTGAGGLTGWYSITVQNLREQSPRLWALCVFSFLQYGYVLRRIWIEWEMFLPLRYDFLERGDFHKEGYQEQYRNSCLVEYVPRSHKLNKVSLAKVNLRPCDLLYLNQQSHFLLQDLYEFFDVLFPGQIRRAEVLINTESLRKLIKERNGHIVSYEDAYARKVHRRAEYLRDLETFREGDSIDRCCRGAIKEPQKPAEEDIIIIHKVHTRQGNFDPRMNLVKDPRTYPALEYYLSRIDVCNGLVDEEFVRLALEKRKPKQEKRSEFWIEKAVGLRYITGSDTGRLHSSTAFVEFCCLTAKQQAIQCNITGTNKFMEVRPAPGLNEIIWGNAHVSRSLINTRRGWANVYLTINLIFWSMFVTFIRSRGNLSKLIPGVGANSSLAVILDAYVPVLILEGLVRIAPFYIAFICQWIRYKQSSEIDIYVLQWYFGFRLVSFLFIIIGGSLVDTASSLVDNPGDFLEEVSYNAARQSLYFTTYITMTTGFSCFFFMSQTHNVLLHWVGLKVFTEEATSARRLEHFQKYIKKFGSRELVPLFIFAMMISLLYGGLAPLTNLFVVIFFKLAYKVYKFMVSLSECNVLCLRVDGVGSHSIKTLPFFHSLSMFMAMNTKAEESSSTR
jgi:hypothetical protein